MNSLKTFALVALTAVVSTLPGAAQGLDRATRFDSYCSGFVARKKVQKKLRIVGAEGSRGVLLFAEGDFVYLGKGAKAGMEVGQRFQIVRAIHDPDPNEIFVRQHQAIAPGWSFSPGYFYQDIGQLEVRAVYPTVSTAEITFSCDAASEGDILVPFENRPPPAFRQTTEVNRFAEPSGLAQGIIIAAKDFSLVSGTGQAVYTDLGERDGIAVGDYLMVFRSGSGGNFRASQSETQGIIRRHRGQEKDIERPKPRKDLPRENIGEAFVVRVERRSSTVIITSAMNEVHPGDFVELQPAPPPEVNLTAWPATIQQGEISTLSWGTRFADKIELRPGPGETTQMGTTNVTPAQTTSYTLVASGPGGTAETTIVLEVIEPPPPPPEPEVIVIPDIPPPPEGEGEDLPTGELPPEAAVELNDAFATSVRDIFFEFDMSNLGEPAGTALDGLVEFMNQYPIAKVTLEGHADEIGTDEYNTSLSRRRAEAVFDYLISMGITDDRVAILSLGETRPFCIESAAESCRALNRRVHFVLQELDTSPIFIREGEEDMEDAEPSEAMEPPPADPAPADPPPADPAPTDPPEPPADAN